MLALNLTLILLTPPRAQPLAVAQAMVPRQLLQVPRQLLQVRQPSKFNPDSNAKINFKDI